jgi:hypothetical protein
MKKVSAIFKAILIVMLISSFSLVSVFAAGIEGETVSLVSENSGYKIVVPNFIDVRTVNVEGEDVTAIAMKAPEKGSDGKYPIFEIVTTDKNAHSVDSFPGVLADGQIGDFSGEFKEGRLMYSPSFAINGDLKDLSKDLVFSFDFSAYNKDYENIFYVHNLNVVFVDEAAAVTPQAEPEQESVVTANPTNSKVMVDGKETAFEAYEIAGNNYFKLRDLAMVVNGTGKQFQVGWDGVNNTINLTANTAYTPDGKELVVSPNPTAKEAKLTKSKIFLNGEEVQFTAYSIGGNNYFKLRDIGKVIDFAVTWDGDLNMIGVDTSNGYIE